MQANHQKTVVITGANRGIGLEFVKCYKALGFCVIAICRQRNPLLRDLADKVIENTDLTLQSDIVRVANTLKGVPVDILVNNAGLLGRETLEDLNLDNMRRQFEINTLAPLHLTQRLLENLDICAQKQGEAKVALITSRMGSIADNGSGERYGYRASKAALNAVGKSLSIDLKHKNIAVGLFHPGWVQTEMTSFSGQLKPEQSASSLVDRISDLNIDNTGGFWHSNGEALPW